MAKGKCDICKGKMGVCTARLQKCRWVIIQPGERLNGIQEVSGSIPLISTMKSSENFGFQNFFFVFSKKKFYYFAPRLRGAKLFDPKMTQT